MSREENRKRMPTVAAVVDQFREFMGVVVYASENGHVIDRRTPEGEVFQIPENYFPSREVAKKERK